MSGPSFDNLLKLVQGDPTRLLTMLDQVRAEESLEEFVVQGWSILEPGTKLKRGWTLGAVCEHLEAITAGQIDRLLMNVPPGFMKSMLTNVFWPMWEWGPKDLAYLRYVCFSYSSSLTERDNDRCRNLLHSQWYRDAWGSRVRLSKDNTIKFENDRRGWKLATSVGGVGTGERGNRVLVDDPHNVKEGESETIRTNTTNWFREVLPSRLNDAEKDVIMVIMQRVHAADVSGVVLAKDHGYTHLNIPMEFEPERRCYTIVKPRALDGEPQLMRYVGLRQRWYHDDARPYDKDLDEGTPPGPEVVETKDQETFDEATPVLVYNQDPRGKEGELAWPERFPQKVIERDQKIMGPFAWAGQMQQRPEPREGAMFKRTWFNIVRSVPPGARAVAGWDLAGTGEQEGGAPAWTARALVLRHMQGDYPKFLIAKVMRMRGSSGEVERALVTTSSQDRAQYPGLMVSLPQDPGQAGKGQARNLCALLSGYTVRATPESGDKVTRAEAAAAQAEVGNIDILEGDWNETFLDELCSFPFGQFKDQVDAFTRAFNELNAAPEPPRIRRL